MLTRVTNDCGRTVRKRVTMTRGADGLIAESDDWWQRDVKRPTATASSEGEIS